SKLEESNQQQVSLSTTGIAIKKAS
ncbi:hypothetical protein BMETH_13646877631472, partial [methanotrophic bacterial endosymbiont of Bathymodiolus sp.]